MRRLWLGVAVLAVVVGACKSDDEGGAEKRSDTTAASSSRSLQDRLIAVDDLPDGFERTSVAERASSDPDPGANSTEFCAEISQHRRNFPGERVAEADFERRRGSASVFVNEQITQYATTADATRALADFEKSLGLCAQVTKKDADGSVVGKFTPVEFVEVGDDTFATTFNATQTVDEDSASISGYFVALRAQRYVVLFSALGSVDTLGKGDVEDVAKRIVAKL